MGLYDTVIVTDPRFSCSEGHLITPLQTKDLGATMGHASIDAQGKLELTIGGWGDPEFQTAAEVTGTLHVYAFCDQCDVMITRHGGGVQIHEAWVEFDVIAVAGVVASVTRTSLPSAEYHKSQLRYPGLAGAEGPMSWEDGRKLALAALAADSTTLRAQRQGPGEASK